MLACRQHGQDRICAFARLAKITRGSGASANDRLCHFRIDVEYAYLKSGLQKVARHWAAHVAHPDEADRRHCRLPNPDSVECEFIRAERLEIFLHLSTGDVGKLGRSPVWRIVFVNDRGAHAFVEVMTLNDSIDHAILHPHAIIKAQAPPPAQLL